MHCPKCGTLLPQGLQFCTNCGTPLNTAPQQQPAPEQPVAIPQGPVAEQVAQQPIAQPQAAPEQPAPEQTAQKKKRGKAGVIISSALVVIVVAAATVLALMFTNVLPNPFIREQQVAFAISAPKYNEKTDSKIPLVITGKTYRGDKVRMHVYVSPKAPAVHLLPGQYQVAVVASPLLRSGELYRVPEKQSLTISSDGATSNGEKAQPKLSFEVKPASEVTQEDIDKATQEAKKSGYAPKKVSQTQTIVTRRRVADVYEGVLDNLNNDEGLPSKWRSVDAANKHATYSLYDLTGDGTPELIVFGTYDHTLEPAGYQWDSNNITDPDVSYFVHAWSFDSGSLQDVKGSIPVGMGSIGFIGVYPSISHKGALQRARNGYQRWVIRNGEWVKADYADGKDNALARDARDNNYYFLSDRRPLKQYAMQDDPGLKTAKKDYQYLKKVSDAAISGAVSVSGTLQVMSAHQVLQAQHDSGKSNKDMSSYGASGSDADALKDSEAQYALIKLDTPQSFELVEMKEADKFPDSTYVSIAGRYSDSSVDEWKKYAGKRITVALDGFTPEYTGLLFQQTRGYRSKLIAVN